MSSRAEYDKAELNYIKDILEQFDVEPEGTTHKEVLRQDVNNKREEFKKLWYANLQG